MARKVFVSSAMSSDEELSEIAEQEPMAALMWPWFLTYFDDWGRAKASPREIKNSVFQANPIVTIDLIKKALQLYNPSLIRLYESEGKWYMSIPPDKWFKFQTHIRSGKRENDGSKIPPPPDEPENETDAQMREIARGFAEVSATARDCTPSPSLSPSPSPSINSGGGNSAANAFGIYEREIGELTYTTSQKLIMLEEMYSGEWLIKAIEQAVYQGVKKLSYIDGTLKRWKKSGHPEPWTQERQEEQKSNVTSFNRYTKGGQRKPQIPVSSGTSAPNLTPEQEEHFRSIARKLQASKGAPDG